MGRGIVESGLVRSERYGLEQRTSDPTSTSEGEMWIRTDLAPDANQLATLRFDAGASTWDVPIYDVAATTTNVEKVWRVPIGGTTGFVPITDDSPTFSALKFQHNGAAFGAHDALTASDAIPDSGNLQTRYDFSQEDGSLPVVDRTGNGYDLDTGTYSGVSRDINGVQAGELDGADDYLAGAVFDTVQSQPNTLYVVAVPDQVKGQHIIDSEGSDRHVIYDSNGSGFGLFAGSVVQTSITGVSLISGLFDGSNSEIRIDGSSAATGDTGAQGMSDVVLGRRTTDNDRYFDGLLGEILVYNTGHSSSTVNDVESYLADKWGLTL